MLDKVVVFTKGGAVLYSKSYAPLKFDVVDTLISDVLIEERAGQTSYTNGNYSMKWILANEIDIVIVAVYQRLFQFIFIDELLEAAMKLFKHLFKKYGSSIFSFVDNATKEFDENFEKTLNHLEKTKKHSKKLKPLVPPVPVPSPSNTSDEDLSTGALADVDESGLSDPPSQSAENLADKSPEDPQFMKMRSLLKKKRQPGGRPRTFEKKKTPQAAPSATAKQNRTWENDVLFYPSKSKNEVDESLNINKDSTQDVIVPIDEKELAINVDDEDFVFSKDEPQPTNGGIWSYLSKLTGGNPLTLTDLEPAVNHFKTHLETKNVASDIADKLCQSVANGLIGKKPGTFSSINTLVRTSLEDALTRILTPKRNIDILLDIKTHKKESGNTPYTIIFMGVNGVGKSTNLAKVASWLRQSGHNPLLAACDTFRSGAVEQLKVHAKRLRLDLYEKGYGKDDTGVAQDAIKHAQSCGNDVVLIDTAGRMQDNEPLMRAIAKLVNTVQPNLVLFVGEALVGNDGVDQLVKFSRSIVDMSGITNPRTIDGIILTKFDTIDDKVGAAISMVYSTGLPIVFVGVGQHYTDIRRLHVGSVVQTLLR